MKNPYMMPRLTVVSAVRLIGGAEFCGAARKRASVPDLTKGATRAVVVRLSENPRELRWGGEECDWLAQGIETRTQQRQANSQDDER